MVDGTDEERNMKYEICLFTFFQIQQRHPTGITLSLEPSAHSSIIYLCSLNLITQFAMTTTTPRDSGRRLRFWPTLYPPLLTKLQQSTPSSSTTSSRLTITTTSSLQDEIDKLEAEEDHWVQSVHVFRSPICCF